jgi:hypothetical protein
MMPRIIARLDVKRDRVVKGISMQGERNVGDPHELAVRYYEQGADELLFVDTYASLVGGTDYLQADAIQIEGADATDTLLALENEGYHVVPTARAAKLTMNREGIRRLPVRQPL